MLPVLAVSGGDIWLMSTPLAAADFSIGPGWRAAQTGAESRCLPPNALAFLPANLARDRRVMGDRWFRQEYLCEFAENQGKSFSPSN